MEMRKYITKLAETKAVNNDIQNRIHLVKNRITGLAKKGLNTS